MARFLTILCLALASFASAQRPEWAFDAAQYAHLRTEGTATLELLLPDKIRLQPGEERSGPLAKTLYWQLIDSLVYPALLGPGLDTLIESAPPKIGGFLDAKPILKGIAAALADQRAEYRLEEWPKHRDSIRDAEAEWSKEISPKWEELLQDATASLRLSKRPTGVRLVFVGDAPLPGAATYRTRGGTLIVVSTTRFRGSDLAEVALHETLHAWDVVNENSFLSALRKELPSQRRDLEQLPHSLMFFAASHAIRQILYPDHSPVGEKYGAYSRGLDRFREHGEKALEGVRKGQDSDQIAKALVAAFAE